MLIKHNTNKYIAACQPSSSGEEILYIARTYNY